LATADGLPPQYELDNLGHNFSEVSPHDAGIVDNKFLWQESIVVRKWRWTSRHLFRLHGGQRRAIGLATAQRHGRTKYKFEQRYTEGGCGIRGIELEKREEKLIDGIKIVRQIHLVV